jgi:hypothetical protein
MVGRRTYFALGAIVLLTGGAALPSLEDYRTVANEARVLAADLAIPDPLQRHWDVEGLRRVKASLLKRDSDLAPLSGRSLVLALRNIAYHQIKVGSRGGNLRQPWDAYNEAVVLRTAEHSCQGINIVYRVMLTAFGIRSREVDFYGDNEVDPGEILYSHATTDVMLDGQWEASDATFDLSVRDSAGNRISWVRAFDLMREGNKISFSHDGLVPIAGRSKKQALSAIGKAMKLMVVIGKETKIEPSTWDGEIDLKGHLRLDMPFVSSSIYFRLPDLISDPPSTS